MIRVPRNKISDRIDNLKIPDLHTDNSGSGPNSGKARGITAIQLIRGIRNHFEDSDQDKIEHNSPKKRGNLFGKQEILLRRGPLYHLRGRLINTNSQKNFM